MADIKQIIKKIKLKQYEFSKHAVDQSIIRDISTSELEQVFLGNALVIEDYPEDKHGASCLALG